MESNKVDLQETFKSYFLHTLFMGWWGPGRWNEFCLSVAEKPL